MEIFPKVYWSSIVSGNEKLHLARINRPTRDAWGTTFSRFLRVFLGGKWHRLASFSTGRERLNAGSFHFVEPHHVHGFEFSGRKKQFQFVNIAIESEVVESFMGRHFGSFPESFWRSNTGKPSKLDLSAMQTATIGAFLTELITGSRRALDAEWFLCSLMRFLQAGEVAPIDYSMPTWLRNALYLMREPVNLQSGLPRLVELCGKSAEHVSRVLRKHSGMRPSDWLNTTRMHYASVLLQTSTLSITDIALECGYDTLSHFHHQFKAVYQNTPRQYRIMHHEGLQIRAK